MGAMRLVWDVQGALALQLFVPLWMSRPSAVCWSARIKLCDRGKALLLGVKIVMMCLCA